ncbi:TPA: hypothetical protein WGP00_002075 [Neisseria meningitidis]|uniref:Uncharacterized protein n=1 Tax=Neisseria meningitidis TaxID=487 RepID=X5F963_NEIME|nr:hypothetical protein [Neisseria meningitidis]ELL11218.1 hypothetical protein NM2004090_0397 [Neisseria meningitidis 2004090]ELL19205.1 hypothetical protein NMNM3652_1726 [Neisseria meningitidis NM3652]ELL24160.1 hypothetical protein NMNM3642_0413 [Neisseria meningitidis NM3642]ELL24454.1 hypothetical protein NM2007056_0393 [Neisseria meningitidis 2007056]ELL28276.1 hypothetical protein NM2001212_0400 [Neisseria meningitidis 2001212]EOB88988.1 hypothetical protein NM2002007_0460 [Neisseria 
MTIQFRSDNTVILKPVISDNAAILKFVIPDNTAISKFVIPAQAGSQTSDAAGIYRK